MNLKLGKRAATYDKRDALFSDFRTSAALPELPKHPRQFGHEKIGMPWGMLGNDIAGDCVFASAAHQTMLWCALPGGATATDFTEDGVLSDYSAVTGYNRNNPDSDQGTNVRDALYYRQRTGVVDAKGVRHKIGGYLALEPGNIEHLHDALWLFGAVEIGINFPDSAMDQFEAHKSWSVVSGARVDGGHDIPLVAMRSSLVCVTWGREQHITERFYKKYCDEAYAIISPDMFNEQGKSPEGFDMKALQDYLVAVARR